MNASTGDMRSTCIYTWPQSSTVMFSGLSPWAHMLYAKMTREEMQKLTDKQKQNNTKMVNKSLKKDGSINVSWSQYFTLICIWVMVEFEWFGS